MTGPLAVTAATAWHQLAQSPWLIAYAAGILTGWGAARRATRYMLGFGRRL